MPRETFRGDPYRVLDVERGAGDAALKRRWRTLARELHPDRAGTDAADAADRTRRMARVNAAYDLLRDAGRRAIYDAAHPEPSGRAGANGGSAGGNGSGAAARASDPAAPAVRPITARFDTTRAFHRRNATTSNGASPLRGHRPVSARERASGPEPLRASQPTGPLRTRRTRGRAQLPSLDESLATALEFGRFRGHTLGEVAAFEPTYIDWIARTITRDRELVVRARVIQADLDERGIERRTKRPSPGWPSRG
ncbi:MAG: DnaJ domain-containing protein [Candidatus Limnocylindrales bacterium]